MKLFFYLFVCGLFLTQISHAETANQFKGKWWRATAVDSDGQAVCEIGKTFLGSPDREFKMVVSPLRNPATMEVSLKESGWEKVKNSSAVIKFITEDEVPIEYIALQNGDKIIIRTVDKNWQKRIINYLSHSKNIHIKLPNEYGTDWTLPGRGSDIAINSLINCLLSIRK